MQKIKSIYFYDLFVWINFGCRERCEREVQVEERKGLHPRLVSSLKWHARREKQMVGPKHFFISSQNVNKLKHVAFLFSPYYILKHKQSVNATCICIVQKSLLWQNVISSLFSVSYFLFHIIPNNLENLLYFSLFIFLLWIVSSLQNKALVRVFIL